MNVRELLAEAGVPLLCPRGRLSDEIAGVDHRRAEAGRAHHRARAAGGASFRHRLPVIAGQVGEQGLTSLDGIELTARLLLCRLAHCPPSGLQVVR